jgi:hypothetical protein
MSAHPYCVVSERELRLRSVWASDALAVSACDGMAEITRPIVESSHLQGLLLEPLGRLRLAVPSLTRLDTGYVDTDARPQTHIHIRDQHRHSGANSKGP